MFSLLMYSLKWEELLLKRKKKLFNTALPRFGQNFSFFPLFLAFFDFFFNFFSVFRSTNYQPEIFYKVGSQEVKVSHKNTNFICVKVYGSPSWKIDACWALLCCFVRILCVTLLFYRDRLHFGRLSPSGDGLHSSAFLF